jgi:hypothetical protein
MSNNYLIILKKQNQKGEFLLERTKQSLRFSEK